MNIWAPRTAAERRQADEDKRHTETIDPIRNLYNVAMAALEDAYDLAEDGGHTKTQNGLYEAQKALEGVVLP